MNVLKSKWLASALLAGAAIVTTGCDAKNSHEDLRGLTDSMAEACPTHNVTRDDQLKCSERGKQHALTLVSYAPLDDKFKKACTFTALKGDLDKMAGAVPKDIVNHLVALNTSRQVSTCLAAVGRSTKDETVRATAYGIRDTMAATMMAKP